MTSIRFLPRRWRRRSPLRSARLTVPAIVAFVAVSLVALPQPAHAARPKVLLVGDSTLAALEWYSSSQTKLNGLDYVLEAASCRAVTAVSCVGRRDADGSRYRPSNAVDVLRAYPRGTFDELVVMAGYDESANTFATSVVELPRVARDRGIDHITWLTFRTGVSYTAPGGESSYAANNRLLVAAANSSGGYIDLLDWNWWVNTHSGLVERDGVHLTSKGASSAASLIRQAVINHWGSAAVSTSTASADSTSAPAGSSASGSSGSSGGDRPTLSYGALGEPVRTAQQLLLDVGSPILEPYGVTGRYYAATRDAVRAFQRMVKRDHDSSMVIDGVVGPATWSWLEQLDGSSGGASSSGTAGTTAVANGTRMVLSYGVLGEPVKELQQILLRIGSPILEPYGVTGRYYAATRDAVRAFQRMVKRDHDSSMAVDGVVGPVTWRWLDRLDPD